MKKFLMIVRCRIFLGHPPSDNDLKALGCYHEIPFYSTDDDREDVEIIEDAYKVFCAGRPEFLFTDSVELIRLA